MQKRVLCKWFYLVCAVSLTLSFSNSKVPDTLRVPVALYDFHSTGACPDFNPPDDREDVTKGMVQNTLDQEGKMQRGSVVYFSYLIENWFRDYPNQTVKNKKPRYKKSDPASPDHGTLDSLFDIDYDTAYKNIKIEDILTFKHTGNGFYEYNKTDFFPIDDKGFGKEPTLSWDNSTVLNDHNYSFAMALKQDFVYTTGLKMTIEGDDDIWVFVNNKLAIDLGGIHTTKTDSVSLDAVATQLGLEAGKQYSITVFFVERQGESSSLSISTNIFKLDTTTGAIKLCAMPDTIVERRPLLTWYKPQQTVPGYTVQISRSSLFTDMVVNDLASDTFYQCKTDLPLFRLYWRVKADSVGTSNIGTFYIRDQRVPVLIPYESPTANRRPVLCWYKPPVPVTGYTLQLSLTIAFAELLVNVQVADTFFACTTDVPINTIYWRVQADSSEFSAPGSFIVKDGRIPIIIPYTPKLTKEKTPILRWKKVENATGYVINIDTTPTFTTLIVNQPVSDVQFVSSVPLPIKKIYWRVKSDLIETWSDVDWFIILPDTIPFLIRYNGETVTTGSPQFKWNPVTGAAPYQLMLADNREFANAFKIPSNDTVYTSPIALKNGTWYWKVSCSKNLGAYPPMDSVVINVVGSQDQSTNNVRPGIVLSAINNSIRIAVQGFKVLPDQVQAAVYDIRGKQIALLQHNGVADPVFIWNYRQNSVPAGAYFLRITAGQRVVVNKIVLNR